MNTTIPNRFNELSSEVQLEVVRLINSLASHKNCPEINSVEILKQTQTTIRKLFQNS